MHFEQLLGVVAGFICFGLSVYFPIRLIMLIGQVKSLEQRLKGFATQAPIAATPSSVAPVEVSAVSAPSGPAAANMPPPLPAKPIPRVASARPVIDQPDPLAARLRDFGLLPPMELCGEYALGAWWAVRVGGVLAVAAVVFLGIWLNLRSNIPAMFRVLEVVLIGVGLFWGGLRLAVKRPDLGQVLAAAGLAVWQFAAWATYGLDKMRVCDSAAQAALVQFLVAFGVAFIAIARGSKLFGQLAVIFAAAAVYLSVGTGAAPWPTATGASLVALLGVILMVRGLWGSAGVLGLIGSQACLLFLYDAMPTKDANYLPLQWAALGSFLVLWLGERLVKDDAVLLGRNARSAFQLASFFTPALISLFLATGGDKDRATVSFFIAAIGVLAGLLERGRSQLVSEVLLLAAGVFVGAGLAWLADPHLVWLIWGLAAAVTMIVGARTHSELVRSSSEALAAVAVFAFIDHPPAKPWVGLAGIAALGLMLAFREDWERVSGWQKFRRFVGILGLAVVVLTVQDSLPKADTGWPWLVLLLVAAVRFRPALLWAAAPGYLFTALLAVFWRPIVGSEPSAWAVIWSALVLVGNGYAMWRLIGRMGDGSRILRFALTFVTAVVLFAFTHHLVSRLLAPATASWSPSSWRLALLWSAGATTLVGITVFWRRLGAIPSDLSLAAFGGLVGFFIQGVVAEGAGLRQLGLAQAPFILLGLACLLHVLTVHTKEQGAWGTVQRAVLGAGALFFMSFVMLAHLPGAGVSLFWALASVLTFVIGHLLATRSLRMVGLVGLVVATLRVLSHDITDTLGRIAACAAVAVAFFGIAWLYGQITADKKDA